jgi:SH3 domain-containing YSC84-like protein 1
VSASIAALLSRDLTNDQQTPKGGPNMKRYIELAIVVLAIAPIAFGATPDVNTEHSRLQNAGDVMQDVLQIPDNIPPDLLNKTRCVIVIPSALKAAFILGASYGRGTMVCRTNNDFTGPWGAPAMYALEGGSLGLQIGGEATDLVLLVVNNRGVDSLLHSKVKLGGDISVAAGPKGRSADADTDAYMRSEILAYSRARGVFAGISLEGSTLRPDNGANRALYGREISAAEIVRQSSVTTPEAGRTLNATLEKASPQLKP